jgi:hypothetical protein
MELKDVMAHMEQGQRILQEATTSAEQRTLAAAAVDLSHQAGRACNAGVLGVMATAGGGLSTSRIAELTGSAKRTVRHARQAAAAGVPNTFTSQTKVQGLTRTAVGEVERRATIAWMHDECPARSGDQQSIHWMSKGKEDFFFENYRSVAAQVSIYQRALSSSEALRVRIARRGQLANQWERNVATYAGPSPAAFCSYSHRIIIKTVFYADRRPREGSNLRASCESLVGRASPVRRG